jgi:hypothetical protein
VAFPVNLKVQAFFNVDTFAKVILEPTASRVFERSAFGRDQEPAFVGAAAAQLVPNTNIINMATMMDATTSRGCSKRDVLIEILTLFIDFAKVAIFLFDSERSFVPGAVRGQWLDPLQILNNAAQ